MFEDLSRNRAKKEEIAGELESLRNRMYDPSAPILSPVPKAKGYCGDSIGRLLARIDSLQRELDKLEALTDVGELERLISLVEVSGELHAADMGRLLRVRYLQGASMKTATVEVFGVLDSTRLSSYLRQSARLLDRAFTIIANKSL